MTTQDAQCEHPVTQRLQAVGITKVAIIDDAYNRPTVDDLKDEISEFCADIIRKNPALAELRSIKASFANEDDIDEVLIGHLWDRALNDQLKALSEPCKRILFSTRLEGLAELAPFVTNLTDIGVIPILLGTNDDLPGEELKLFFLDFFLGPNPTPIGPGSVERAINDTFDGTAVEPSIQASIDKARQILTDFEDPFIVLMSSKDEVERVRDRFREEIDLIDGMFDYVTKIQLADKKDLYLRLGTSAIGLPVRHDIQRFVDSMAKSVKQASEDFISRMKSLSFEDYLYVYSLSLREEGHPLGDYMAGLYKSLLAHLVHNDPDVIEAQGKLDGVDMGKYVPLKKSPSLHLADTYRRSLTEPGVARETSHLRLGDLYVKDTEDVLLVINAACDLLYSAQNPKRPFPADLSILLHPGSLKPIEEIVNRKWKVTHLFELDGNIFKIVWNHERVLTIRYGEAVKWLESEGYSKKARLIAAHALEIQQHFAATLTRVGMPVAPPFPRSITVQLFARREDGSLAKLGEDIQRAVVVDKEGFRFTVEGFHAILDRVNEAMAHYTLQHEALANGDARYGKLGKQIDKLEALLQDCPEWFTIVEKVNPMPNQNGLQLGSSGIFKVFCTQSLQSADCLIAINLAVDAWDSGVESGALGA